MKIPEETVKIDEVFLIFMWKKESPRMVKTFMKNKIGALTLPATKDSEVFGGRRNKYTKETKQSLKIVNILFSLVLGQYDFHLEEKNK